MYIFVHRKLQIIRIFSLSTIGTVTPFKKFCGDHNTFISRNIIENFVINFVIVIFVYSKIKVLLPCDEKTESLHMLGYTWKNTFIGRIS